MNVSRLVVTKAVDDLVEVLDMEEVNNDEAVRVSSNWAHAMQEALLNDSTDPLDAWVADNTR